MIPASSESLVPRAHAFRLGSFAIMHMKALATLASDLHEIACSLSARRAVQQFLFGSLSCLHELRAVGGGASQTRAVAELSLATFIPAGLLSPVSAQEKASS